MEKLDRKTRFLVRNHPQLPKLRAMEIAAVFSGNHSDPESWWEWADKAKQEEFIKRFKRKFAPAKSDKTDPLSILVVMNMLLTGFDAPVEQVLYLDLRDDLLPGNLRMLRLEGRRHEAGGLTDDLNGTFHSKLQLPIGKILVEGHVNGEISNGTCRVEHVP